MFQSRYVSVSTRYGSVSVDIHVFDKLMLSIELVDNMKSFITSIAFRIIFFDVIGKN